jgi:feruloyl esterase
MWVEQGRRPERVTASRIEDGKVVRTRPLCAYPKQAVWRGSGSTDQAANFLCKAPPS